MILMVKTDGSNLEMYLYENGTCIEDKSIELGRELSRHILEQLQELFAVHGKTLQKDISGIVVYQGPGSFTSLRIGITVCNTLAYAAPAPIVGTQGDSWREDGLARLNAQEDDKIAMPFYGAEAHITSPRK